MGFAYPNHFRRSPGRGGFTLIEMLIAGLALSVMLIGLCEILQLAVKRWNIQESYSVSVGATDVILQRVEADARYATSFQTQPSGGNTLYVFTLPANQDAQGNYTPVRVAGALQYASGPRVAFYLSDSTGLQGVVGGTDLWRATAPAGSTTFTPDRSFSLVNTNLPRCTGIQAFNITTLGMPVNSAQISFSLSAASGFQTKTYSIVRQLHMGSVPWVVTPPTNLTATPGASSVGLAWSAVPGAVSYNVYRGTTSGGENATAYATGIAAPSYTDTFVAAGTTYYYEATAVFSTESAVSSEASATMAPGYVSAAPTTPGSSEWHGEDDVNITTTMPITAMTATVTVVATTGWSLSGASNTFTNGYISQSAVASGADEVYTFTLNPGDIQAPGVYKLASAFNLTGTSHPTAADTFSLQVTSGGVTQMLNGHF